LKLIPKPPNSFISSPVAIGGAGRILGIGSTPIRMGFALKFMMLSISCISKAIAPPK
jgi:hypothetical protein